VSASSVRASMAFWLRENACLIMCLSDQFRFTIGKRIGRSACFESVRKLRIGSVTGNSMAGVDEGEAERILSKRHPKRCMSKQSVSRNKKMTFVCSSIAPLDL
jgi:hypothetical protein